MSAITLARRISPIASHLNTPNDQWGCSGPQRTVALRKSPRYFAYPSTLSKSSIVSKSPALRAISCCQVTGCVRQLSSSAAGFQLGWSLAGKFHCSSANKQTTATRLSHIRSCALDSQTGWGSLWHGLSGCLVNR